MRRPASAIAALLLALTTAPAAVVIPAPLALLVQPAKHQPRRGPSRDRALPGKARRHARRKDHR